MKFVMVFKFFKFFKFNNNNLKKTVTYIENDFFLNKGYSYNQAIDVAYPMM